MSLDMIIALVLAGIAAVAGALAGHARGKSVGKSQGAAEATAGISLAQSKKAAASAQERTHVEAQIADSADDDLDLELQRHSRPD